MYQDRTETIDEKSKSVKRCLRQKSLRGSVETVENEIAARADAAKALSDAKTHLEPSFGDGLMGGHVGPEKNCLHSARKGANTGTRG